MDLVAPASAPAVPRDVPPADARSLVTLVIYVGITDVGRVEA
jgi:hypothetical protein